MIVPRINLLETRRGGPVGSSLTKCLREWGNTMGKNVLVVHASPRLKGNSNMLAEEFERGAKDAGNEVKRIDVGHARIAGCMACEHCFKHEGQCCQQDDMQEFYPMLHWADVIVFATPMYYYNFPAQLRAFQDRMFCGIAKPFKIPQMGLLLCFEDDNVERCYPAVNSLKVCADYCKQEFIGEVIVPSVYEAGAIAGNPGLQKAYEFGASIK